MNQKSILRKYKYQGDKENYKIIFSTLIINFLCVSLIYFLIGTNFLIAYYTGVNLVTGYSFYQDKKRAKRLKWRYPEKFLKVLGWIGGSLGGIVGMKLFHHKTSVREFYTSYACSGFIHLLLLLILR